MKIFSASHIKYIDNYTITHEPISSIDLMKRAAYKFYIQVITNLPLSAPIKVFAGPGNNGGDAFFVAEKLLEDYKNLQLYICSQGNTPSEDCQKAKEIFTAKHAHTLIEVSDAAHLPTLSPHDYIIDGLFGSGLNRPLTGFYAEVVQHINNAGATVFAIDIPSGLMLEDNAGNIPEHIIRANYTFTFQFPKLAFLIRIC